MARSRRETIWLALLVLVAMLGAVHQSFRTYCVGRFNPDKVQQIAAARALLMGRGITYPEANEADLLHPRDVPLAGRPPGYTIVFAPVLLLVQDVWTASFILDTFSIGLAFSAWFAILLLLGRSLAPHWKVLILAFWALVCNPLIWQTSVELLSFGLFSWAVAFCMLALENRRPILWATLSGLCMAGCAACRFAYWPLVLACPLAIVIASLSSPSRRRLWVAAAANAATAIAAIGAVSLYQKAAAGHATAMSTWPTEKGWYWENLLRMPPFAAEAFGIPPAWSYLAGKVPALGAVPQWWVYSAASCVILAIALLPLLRSPGTVKRLVTERRDLTRTIGLAVIGVLTAALTLGMLCYLTVRLQAQELEAVKHSWSAADETRYYTVFFGFLYVAVAYSLSRLMDTPRSGSGSRCLRWGLLGLLATCFLVGAAAHTRKTIVQAVNYRGNAAPRLERIGRQRDDRALYDIMNTARLQGRTVFFVVENAWRRNDHISHAWNIAVMAGSCPLPVDLYHRLRPKLGDPVAVFLFVPREDGEYSVAESRALASDRQAFREVLTTYGGQLYEKLGNTAP